MLTLGLMPTLTQTEESILTNAIFIKDNTELCARMPYAFLRTIIVEESKIGTFERNILQCENTGAYMYRVCSVLSVYFLILRVL